MLKKFLTILLALLISFSVSKLAISQIDRKTKDDLYSQIKFSTTPPPPFHPNTLTNKKPKL